MVIGDGMIAKAFAAFRPKQDVVIFASGVSDSLETRIEAFERERALLAKARSEHREALLVYFSTCSVDDPDRRPTPYVQHKLAMEAQLAAASGPWLLLRLPLAIGPVHRSPTLANFLHDRIVRGEAFEVWSRSIRYPIDVEDVVRIAARFIDDRAYWRQTINVALRPFSVLDFVRIFEGIAGKRAVYRLVDKGARYDVPCPEVAKLAKELDLDLGSDYLERVLRRYF